MLASNLELLRHISDEVDFVLQSTNGKTKNEVINDGILCRAMVRSLEVIGEATKKMDDEFKARYPYIEWKKWPGPGINLFMIILVWIMKLCGALLQLNCLY